MAALVALKLWLLWRATGGHADRRPFGLAVIGGVLAVVGLNLHPLGVTLGLLLLVVVSGWDFFIGRRARNCDR